MLPIRSQKITSKEPCKTRVCEWRVAEVLDWAKSKGCTEDIRLCLEEEQIDGMVLLALTEHDIRELRYRFNHSLTFGELKKLWLSVHDLQQQNSEPKPSLPLPPPVPYVNTLQRMSDESGNFIRTTFPTHWATFMSMEDAHLSWSLGDHHESYGLMPKYIDSQSGEIPSELFKTFISIVYLFLVTAVTSFVMVIVHDRVPDMKRYPPLPDIFLDNVPHIPWAFNMSELTGTLLFLVWAVVCVFHRYRSVLLRRFFALAGTVFLLRCITMLITSLSVPGPHLQCSKEYIANIDEIRAATQTLRTRISRAFVIWSGMGMSVRGIRTCGDYMFSGHTVALTLLNFCITEYTPSQLYFLHTLSWLLNMFGIFFILAAHEHYSIDVFVAFYITSRLFLYYHTLANNQALMSRDSKRTRIWFPMFSYFESSVHGIIPNEFDSLGTVLNNCWLGLLAVKDACMLTARRCWIENSSSKTGSYRGRSNVPTAINTPTSQPSVMSIAPKEENLLHVVGRNNSTATITKE